MKVVWFKAELLPIINQTGFTNRLALPTSYRGEIILDKYAEGTLLK